MFHVKHSVQTRSISPEETLLIKTVFNESASKLKAYNEQLSWWNNRINLLSRDVSRETITQHILHSLCVGLSEIYKENDLIVDAGTGGGLPGIPLSIVSPDKQFVLNDIVSKKITAVKQMIRTLGLKNAEGVTGSVGDIDMDDDFLIISKHAFKIPDLLRLVSDKKWKGIVLLKGYKDVEEEIKHVQQPLSIRIVSLDAFDNTGFYNGKGLVEITK